MAGGGGQAGPLDPAADAALTRTNRRVLAALCAAFLVMSVGVYLDTGEAGEQLVLDEQGRLGVRVWREKNCIACHQLYGMGGYIGPDLTNAISRVGGRTVEWVLGHGRGAMPDFEITREEAAGVAAFLEAVDATGTFPPRSWPPKWFAETDRPAPREAQGP